jgi:Zn-dependent protease with chaperone function
MLRRILVIWHNSFARFIHYTFDSFSGQQVPENLVLHIKSLCKKYAVKIPKIVKILKKTVCLSILPSYGVGKPIIFISDGAILKLTEAEIKAAIAHEIGHIKQGIWKFYMLRTIAIICGYPPWFLMLLIDLRGIEEDADKFALDVGEEPVALSQAIIKTSVPGYYSGQQMPSTLLVLCDRIRIIKPVLKACRLVLIIDSFLCTDELIGFSHPTPKDRIATIMAGTKVISDTA